MPQLIAASVKQGLDALNNAFPICDGKMGDFTPCVEFDLEYVFRNSSKAYWELFGQEALDRLKACAEKFTFPYYHEA